MENKDQIFWRAIHDCMKEMYDKAQPSADYDQLIKAIETGKINKDEPVYERFYLSQEEFLYIREKYLDMYNFRSMWKGHMSVLESYLKNGGLKNMQENNENSYVSVPPIKKQIFDIISTQLDSDEANVITQQLTDAVMNTVSECKNFYRYDADEASFIFNVTLGSSPTSNPDTVKEYWKSQGIDLEITERNPLLFQKQDYYGDEFEEVMEEEYGKDWKKYWDDQWQEQRKNK
jgi:hypothetical protein